MLSRMVDKLVKLETILISLILVFIVGINVLEIFARTFNIGSLGWPQELSMRLIIWSTYLGLGVLIKKDELLRVDVVLRGLSFRARKHMVFIQNLILLAITILLLKYFIDLYKVQSLRTFATLNLALSFGLIGPIIAMILNIPILISLLLQNISNNYLSSNTNQVGSKINLK